MASIAIIGSGYVGLCTAVVFAEMGHEVIGVDIDAERVALLQSGACPIFEPKLDQLLHTNVDAGRLRFITEYHDAVPHAEFVFICVNTPMSLNGGANMSAVRAAARDIGRHLNPNHHTIIVNKSTMPIGSADLVHALVQSTARVTTKFTVVSNPEFLREGSAVEDMLHPDRIVLGASSRDCAESVARLYEPIQAPVLITDLRTAEMIKYASNAFLATKISFINEVARISEALGADIRQVAEGMGMDTRIGPRFLDAGIGFGGSCFPKDVKALEFMAAEADCHPQLLRTVLEINRDARHGFVRRMANVLGDLEGLTIAVWGLAFKPNTDDLREAPAIDIITDLLIRGARVQAYDPAAMEGAQKILPAVRYCNSAYDAVEGAHAVALVTEWNEFERLDLREVRRRMLRPVMFDGRNLYDPEEMARLGFHYRGIGVQVRTQTQEFQTVAQHGQLLDGATEPFEPEGINVASLELNGTGQFSREQWSAE